MASTHEIKEGEIPKAQTKAIWRTFWVLSAVTAVEFIIALGLPIAHWIKVGLYAILTIVKAAYIVGEFMHLRHEVKFLIWAILLPMIFVAWLLLALVWEGGAIFNYGFNR